MSQEKYVKLKKLEYENCNGFEIEMFDKNINGCPNDIHHFIEFYQYRDDNGEYSSHIDVASCFTDSEIKEKNKKLGLVSTQEQCNSQIKKEDLYEIIKNLAELYKSLK